ncbi:MAG: tripartite tricarboxylate transporter substrate-binding protein [Alphaproteobacteria bacterium]
MRALAVALGILVVVLMTLPAEAARKALVIGNSAYKARPLANPVNDAADMAKRLEGLGFAVTTATDATRRQMAAAILAFHRSLAAGDEAVVFYAGHGLQVRGQNWLLPVDVDPQSEEEVEYDAIALDSILRGLAAAGARASLVLLDACRDNPFEQRFRGGTRGLARVEAAASGTLVSYAAKPGTVAADGQGRNSPYTAAWLAALAEPGLTHHQILDRVHVAVKRATGDRQETWQEGQMVGGLVLNAAAPAAQPVPGQASPPVPAFDPRIAEVEFWRSADGAGTKAALQAYLAQYPQGQFAALAKAKLEALQPAPAPVAPPPSVAVEERDAVMVTTATANVRAAPLATAEKLDTLAAGTKVTITGKAKGSDWLRVERPGGGVGWVFASLLAEPAASAPARPAATEIPAPAPQVAPQPVRPPQPAAGPLVCTGCPAGWPSRPVTLVVPFAPGGSTDNAARVVAEKLLGIFDQPVIIENRAGAGGSIGTGAVARAAPDGYTLLMGDTNIAINPALRNDLPYDARRQLAPVVQLVETISIAVVNPAFPAQSFAELVAQARRSGVYAAVPGTGSIPHLALVHMNRTLGTKFEFVPYSGATPALLDVLANQVPVMVTNLVSVASQIKSGQLRALAVLGPQRAPGLPNVPSVVEAGYPEAAVPTMMGLFTPAGTPAGVVDYVSRAVNAVLAEPQIRERLETFGYRVVGGSPADLAAAHAAMHDHYARLIREAGIKPPN